MRGIMLVVGANPICHPGGFAEGRSSHCWQTLHLTKARRCPAAGHRADDFAFRFCDTQLVGFSLVFAIISASKMLFNFVFCVFYEIQDYVFARRCRKTWRITSPWFPSTPLGYNSNSAWPTASFVAVRPSDLRASIKSAWSS